MNFIRRPFVRTAGADVSLANLQRIRERAAIDRYAMVVCLPSANGNGHRERQLHPISRSPSASNGEVTATIRLQWDPLVVTDENEHSAPVRNAHIEGKAH